MTIVFAFVATIIVVGGGIFLFREVIPAGKIAFVLIVVSIFWATIRVSSSEQCLISVSHPFIGTFHDFYLFIIFLGVLVLAALLHIKGKEQALKFKISLVSQSLSSVFLLAAYPISVAC